jgi:hypothetical protein
MKIEKITNGWLIEPSTITEESLYYTTGNGFAIVGGPGDPRVRETELEGLEYSD